MDVFVLDSWDAKRLVRRRRSMRGDRWDEVWDGVYLFMPLVDNEHHLLVYRLRLAISEALEARWGRPIAVPHLPPSPLAGEGRGGGAPADPPAMLPPTLTLPRKGGGDRKETSVPCQEPPGEELELVQVFPGCNVSDRAYRWKRNYRCPNLAVFLPGNPAEDRSSHFFGGPDFAAEIVTPNDRSREKLGFYAKVGVRELLIVDRQPWRLELYRRSEAEWSSRVTGDPGDPESLASAILPLIFRLVPGDPRPQIEVTQTSDGQRWLA